MATTAEHPTSTTAAYPARRRRSPAGAFWTFWGALALMLLFGWLIWNFVHDAGFKDADARRADERAKIYNDVAAASEKALRDPASYLNKEKGAVRLPIDQAVRLTLDELKNSQPRAAYPLTQSPPVPNPPPATAAPAAGQPGAVPASATNPVLPNGSAAGAQPIQPDKPNPSSGAVLGPTPGGNPPPGSVPAPTPQPDASASPTPTPAPTPEAAIPASHMQPSPTPH